MPLGREAGILSFLCAFLCLPFFVIVNFMLWLLASGAGRRTSTLITIVGLAASTNREGSCGMRGAVTEKLAVPVSGSGILRSTALRLRQFQHRDVARWVLLGERHNPAVVVIPNGAA